jgi:hypothetical protein
MVDSVLHQVKAVQAVDSGPIEVDRLTDAQLEAIASGMDPLALPPPDKLILKPR